MLDLGSPSALEWGVQPVPLLTHQPAGIYSETPEVRVLTGLGVREF